MLMFLKKLKKSKVGYTLTELIVVVAILGVLAAVATPLVSGQIAKAKKNADDANVTTIENVVKIKLADGETSFPTTDIGTTVGEWVEASLGTIPKAQQGSSYTFNVKNTSPYDVECATSVTDGYSKIE